MARYLQRSASLSTDSFCTLADDLGSFDRQFKELLERTERFTNRAEKFQNTASHIGKDLSKVTSTLSTYRRRSYDVGVSFASIRPRFYDYNDSSTELEWRRLVDEGTLLKEAIELLRYRIRYPKSEEYEYSPSTRSPYSADYSFPQSPGDIPNYPINIIEEAAMSEEPNASNSKDGCIKPDETLASPRETSHCNGLSNGLVTTEDTCASENGDIGKSKLASSCADEVIHELDLSYNKDDDIATRRRKARLRRWKQRPNTVIFFKNSDESDDD